MGWVSLLEDALEKIQDNIRLAKTALANPDEFAEIHRQESLRALNDAQAILVRAWEHLDLATSPEINLAHENEQLNVQLTKLEHKLKVAQGTARKAKDEAASYYAELQDCQREERGLKKRYRKLEKDFEKVTENNFGSAVDAFSSPGMMKKHKPIR